MRGNEFLDKMEHIDPAYVEAADMMPKRKRNSLKKWCAMAACLCLVFSFAVPAMAAATLVFNDILYEISPATAQFFKPVQLSCEDNGIRMEVVASHIHEDTAEIYISVQDLEATRFDETIDLFDSYQIHTPFDCTEHCKLASYDPDTQTATFLITIEQWNEQNIIGDKLTFSIREFLSNKKTYEGVIDVNIIELNSATQTVHPRGVSGTDFFNEYISSNTRDGVTVLKTVGSISSPINGVALTGVGYVDGYFHVQVYYEDILKTDNHGSVALLNRGTGEMINCNGSVSFFDDAEKGSYQDYIFMEIPVDTLGNYDLYGDFVTSSGSVEGTWSVTFPLEDNTGE